MLIALCFFIGYIFVLGEQIRCLQIQYYEPIRFLKLFRFNLKSLLVALLLIPAYFFPFLIPFTPLLLINFKKKIPKLKFTWRIRRLILTLVLINGCLFYLTTFFPRLAILILVFAPFIVLAANYIIQPVEAMIFHQFLKQAKLKLKQSQVKIIAITGSYGKTSTKNYLYHLLTPTFRVLMTPLSYNTLKGIVKTINTELEEGYDYFIVEIGVDKKGGMDKILKLLEVDYAIITAIGNQHLATFVSLDNIIQEKLKLAWKAKKAVYFNNNNEYLRLIDLPLNILRYSYLDDQIRASEFSYVGFQTSFVYCDEIHQINLTTKILGKHQIENLLPCIHLSLFLGVEEKKIINALLYLTNQEHRLSVSKVGHITILDDAYNANVQGFIGALEVLKKQKVKRILVTPGVIELGNMWISVNNQLGEYASVCCDLVILVDQKQTVPFKDGLIKGGFPLNNIIVTTCFKHAQAEYLNIKEECVVLIENDLPDVRIN